MRAHPIPITILASAHDNTILTYALYLVFFVGFDVGVRVGLLVIGFLVDGSGVGGFDGSGVGGFDDGSGVGGFDGSGVGGFDDGSGVGGFDSGSGVGGFDDGSGVGCFD